jgi:hypothetical protein
VRRSRHSHDWDTDRFGRGRQQEDPTLWQPDEGCAGRHRFAPGVHLRKGTETHSARLRLGVEDHLSEASQSRNWLEQVVTPPLAMEAPTAPRLVAQVVVAATRPLRLIQRARVGPRPRTRTYRTLASKAASQTLQLCQGHLNTRAARWQSDGTSCAPISRTTSL